MSNAPSNNPAAIQGEARGDTPLWPAAWTLCRRELVRFVRQRARVVASIATPLMIWAMFGFGLRGSFQLKGDVGGTDFLAYFFPGTIFLTVLFTAIFSNISVIEDRNLGFMQAVLVAPVHRAAIVLGKVLGGALLGMLQGVLLLAVAPMAGLHLTVGGALLAAAIMFIVSFALTGLGFMFAWKMESVGAFHGVMNMILMPMWVLSGAMFPVSGASRGMVWIVLANPLSYGMAALRESLGGGDSGMPGDMATWLAASLGFAAVTFAFSMRAMRPRANEGRK